jgi:hypothetical protein
MSRSDENSEFDQKTTSNFAGITRVFIVRWLLDIPTRIASFEVAQSRRNAVPSSVANATQQRVLSSTGA